MQATTSPELSYFINNYVFVILCEVTFLVASFFCTTFALAYVKARYDSRFDRSMETRLTLRSPHSKQPPAWFTLGTPIRTRRMGFWKWSIAERFFESEACFGEGGRTTSGCTRWLAGLGLGELAH